MSVRTSIQDQVTNEHATIAFKIVYYFIGWILPIASGLAAAVATRPAPMRSGAAQPLSALTGSSLTPPQVVEPSERLAVPSLDEIAHESWRRTRIIDRRVIRGRDLLIYGGLVAAWLTANVVFWSWWLQPEHIVTWPRMIVASIAIAYDLTLMPAVFIFFLWQMKKPDPIAPPAGLRVAMATAIVPSSESLSVLARTLAAMTAVEYPHDNWVLDEGGDPRVRRLCEEFGAHYWSRAGVPEFNQEEWPFQAKTKSGNYNSWFSTVAYDDYDYIVQLDTDHAPVPSYLDEVLGYFCDPNVSYVAMPSIYWNLDDWTSRGSSEQSQVFQGPIQMGYYGWAKTPMIIGSHAAYRVEHLKEIGGFAPSRAEDHLDTLRFAQHGHTGVFVPKNLASGLGPHNISDYLLQEHQWAFSIAQVLMKYGRQKGQLNWKQRCVFLFSELWYGLFSLTYLVLFALPLFALATNRPIVDVPFFMFVLFSLPIILVSIIGLVWGHRQGWFRPGTHFFLSWQGIVLAVARWPIVLVALVNAVISVVFRGGKFTYVVTPKGARAIKARDMLRVVSPYIGLGALTLASSFAYPVVSAWRDQPTDAAGYLLFTLMSATFFAALIGMAFRDYLHANIQIGISWWTALRQSTPLAVASGAFVLAIIMLVSMHFPAVSGAATYWPGVIDTRPEAQTVAQAAPAIPERTTPTPTEPVFAESPTAAATPTPAATEPLTRNEAPAPMPESVSPEVAAVESWLFTPERQGVTFGAYDPPGTLADLSGLNHIFMRWTDEPQAGIPVDQIRGSYAAGVPVMLALEPWGIGDLPSEDVLTDISAGEYDEIILEMAGTIEALEQPVLIRFGHEMDLDGMYPWSGQRPANYIAANRHIVDIFRSNGVDNVLWVWSPAGTLEALDYYPGDAYVDYVGVTILQFMPWETEAGYAEARPIETLIAEKYYLLEPLQKPILLAEVGVALEPDLKSSRIEEMIEVLPDYPLIRGVFYFNQRNPSVAVTPHRPDWALQPDQIATLRSVIGQYDWLEQQAKAVEFEPAFPPPAR